MKIVTKLVLSFAVMIFLIVLVAYVGFESFRVITVILEAQGENQVFQDVVNRYYITVFLLVGVAIAGTLAIAYTINKMIVVPIKKITSVADEIANGNFEARTGILGDDEISQLAWKFDKMILHLSALKKALDENSPMNKSIVNRERSKKKK